MSVRTQVHEPNVTHGHGFAEEGYVERFCRAVEETQAVRYTHLDRSRCDLPLKLLDEVLVA